ncbi:hypothetical protein DDP46_08345, partial [Helicobacter pylori]
KIIEELTNGVKQASEEIKEKTTKYEKALQELQKIDESKLTKNTIKTQEPLSPLEQANAEKLAKLESEALQSEQEFLKAKEQEKQRKEALK